MRQKARDIAARIDSRGFSTDENTNLGQSLTDLGELYQKGTIFYKEYKRGAVPSEQELREDLSKMMDIYKEYVGVKPTTEMSDSTSVLRRDQNVSIKEDVEYLITDSSNGKKYVGSAAGENMIWGRWKGYIANGNGGNIELKSLDFGYIQKNFRYSILEIYKSATADDAILDRESWWKELLMTRQFGYNKN